MDESINCLLCGPNGTHTMMDAARTKATLRDLKPTPFAEKHVAHRNANIVENYLCMIVNVAEKAKRTQNSDPWGITWNKDHRMLLVSVSLVCLSTPQENKNFALWAAS